MTRTLPVLLIVALLTGRTGVTAADQAYADNMENKMLQDGEYSLVVEGYDWGPAVSRIILHMNGPVTEVNPGDFTVFVKRSTECMEITGDAASGERTVIHAYVSDENGDNLEGGNCVTLVLFVSPRLAIGSPFQYVRSETCRGNVWVDYQVTVIDRVNNRVWDTEAGRISPLADRFDLTGRYRYSDDLTMSYAYYAPGKKSGKSPLIIWLHGGGEGGTDPSIPLLANRAANYASDEIQTIFKGAYVLAPQCPGAWMHNAAGVMTAGAEDDVYHVGLMALIKDFVADHPDIDTDRIYVGGCSNGGYMSLKLILEHPGYFAAGYISALAYESQYITDEQIESIRHVPIWFVHAADDGTTIPDQTVLPVYKRLKDAGAGVHLSYYDHVVDITGFYGGEDYHYAGHWSWIYCHANKCRLDLDGSPVEVDGRPVTIMEWVAAQVK